MPSANHLVELFRAIQHNLQQEQSSLNALDGHDGDAGDNMSANFALVSEQFERALQSQQGQPDLGAALEQAARALREQGRGATAPIYAQGLAEAAQPLRGQSNFSLDQLQPLLEGLLRGSQQASGEAPGQGSLLDALLPGILAYSEAKRSGSSELQALLRGLMSSRRGAAGTAQSPNAFGRARGTDTQGRIDPGAAGAASLLEGLFGALLGAGLGRQQQKPQPPQAPQRASGQGGGLEDLLGGLFGGGSAGGADFDDLERQRGTSRA